MKNPQDPRHLPEPPESPLSPTPAQLEALEWADDERKRWEALGNALETMHSLGDYLRKGQHPKEVLEVQIKPEFRLPWHILFKRLRLSIHEEMAIIIQDLLDAGHEPPEGAQEEV